MTCRPRKHARTTKRFQISFLKVIAKMSILKDKIYWIYLVVISLTISGKNKQIIVGSRYLNWFPYINTCVPINSTQNHLQPTWHNFMIRILWRRTLLKLQFNVILWMPYYTVLISYLEKYQTPTEVLWVLTSHISTLVLRSKIVLLNCISVMCQKTQPLLQNRVEWKV